MKILSRMKPAVGGETSASSSEKKRKTKTKKIPKLEDYLNQRDYLGALTLLEVQAPLILFNEHWDFISTMFIWPLYPLNCLSCQFQRNGGVSVDHEDQWIGYCAFHLGDHRRSMEVSQRDDWCESLNIKITLINVLLFSGVQGLDSKTRLSSGCVGVSGLYSLFSGAL